MTPPGEARSDVADAHGADERMMPRPHISLMRPYAEHAMISEHYV